MHASSNKCLTSSNKKLLETSALLASSALQVQASSSNKCLTSSNKFALLVVTSASLVVTSALLVVTSLPY